MELILEDREAEVLARVLNNYLPQLREEIYKTENADWRASMHEDESIIKSLISRLNKATVDGK